MLFRILGSVFLLLASGTLGNLWAQGIIFPGTGAVNRAMGGASTAAPVDAAGAIYWNPAVISGLLKNQVFVGADFLYADTFLDSAVEATGRAGSNRSDSGLGSAPSIALVYRPEDSTFSYGLGVNSLVGRNIDFPGSDTNPVLTPYNPPNSFGFGPVSARLSGLQISPMLSKRLSDTLSLGVGGIVTSMSLSLDPALFADRNPIGTFPPATQARPYWGAGFQAGVLYTFDGIWNFGASFKSRQIFETFEYNSKNSIGMARKLQLELEFPMILSFGTAYYGIEKTVFSADLRYFNYSNTKLFGEHPVDGGLGWENIWAIAAGLQREVGDNFKVLGGFTMNGNPIPDAATLFNIQLPSINQFAISAGLTYSMTETVELTGSVVYALRHSIGGSILEIPGTAIELRQDMTTISLGFTFNLN
jgi:long-chain fatty acid transport protein